MKTLVCLATLAMVIALSGCDRIAGLYVSQAMQQSPTTVISPGYKVLIKGELVPIFGNDKCPTQGGLMPMLFGEEPLEEQSNCLVLDKGKTSITVLVGYKSGLVTEQWVIRRQETRMGEREFLLRSDGEMVRAAVTATTERDDI